MRTSRTSSPTSSLSWRFAAAPLFVTLLTTAACSGSSAGSRMENGGSTASGQGGQAGAAASGAAGRGSGGAGAIGAGGSGGTKVSGVGGTAPSGAAGSNAGLGGTSGATGAGGATKVGVTQCNDGIDNDGDGLIDTADPECTGPLDNDESSFATGIPGDNMDACKQDCFFDGNSGMGDDGCLWQLQCDPLSTEPKCAYSADFVSKHATECSISDSQTQHCIDFCQKRTPNGCDCFGCCTVPGATTPIRLAATCKTAADFADPTKCPPCTQVTQCMNTCGHCQLCLGKTVLPPDCVPDGGAPDGGDGGTPVPQCDPGVQACGPGLPGCPENSGGCITGCCITF